jgi:transposase
MNIRDMLIPGNADASDLIDQMDRKESLFSQIGEYISKVQNETGQNAAHVRKKLLELQQCREEITALEEKVTTMKVR